MYGNPEDYPNARSGESYYQPQRQPPRQGRQGYHQQERTRQGYEQRGGQPPLGQPPQQSSRGQQGGGQQRQGGTTQQGGGMSQQGQQGSSQQAYGQPPQQGGGQQGYGRQPQQGRASYGQQRGGGAYQYQQSGAQPQGQFQQPSQMHPPGTTGQQERGQRSQLRPVTLEEIVQTDVVTVQPDETVSEVVGRMAEEEVGSVVVVEDDEPVGIVTDRAIALSLEGTADVAERSVEEVMDTELVTATTETTVFDAIGTLEEAGVRRLPIVDDEGGLEGIVTLDDILVLLGSEFDNAAGIIRSQSTRY